MPEVRIIVILLTIGALLTGLAAAYLMWRATQVKHKPAYEMPPLRWDRAPDRADLDALHYGLDAAEKTRVAALDTASAAKLNRWSAALTVAAVLLSAAASLVSVLSM